MWMIFGATNITKDDPFTHAIRLMAEGTLKIDLPPMASEVLGTNHTTL
jgi:hypothetical protein